MTLDLQGLSVFAPDGTRLFAPLTLTIPPGKVTSVMGPSGAGKSTLLDAVGGHLAAGLRCSGRVVLNGSDISTLPAEARHIGVMFQDALLFPHLSVGDNLAFGLPPGLKGREKRRAAVEAALDQAGLSGFHARDPATLSGGQKARAALMRTLLADPQALLLDEPFSKLDAGLRTELRGFVFEHIRTRAIPTLLVTHDPADSEAAGGPVVQIG